MSRISGEHGIDDWVNSMTAGNRQKKTGRSLLGKRPV